MELNFSQKDRHLIIFLNGDLDHHAANEIKDKIDREFMRAGAVNMIFDFSRVSFMDSSGIGMVIGRYKNLEKIGGKAAITGMSAEMERIFTISGLHKIIKTYATPEEAISNL